MQDIPQTSTAFRESCISLCQGKEPDWTEWAKMNDKEQHILMDIMVLDNHPEVIVGFVEHGPGTQRIVQLSRQKRNRYHFPALTCGQLDRIAEVSKKEDELGWLWYVTWQTALKTNKAYMLYWAMENPHLHKIARHPESMKALSSGLATHAQAEDKHMAFAILDVLHTYFNISLAEIKDNFALLGGPDLYALYQQDVLHKHISCDQAGASKPRVM